MKMVRMALTAALMSGLSLGALLLPVAASHYDWETLPNGVLWEPINPDANGGSRT
jgi:hypothetical protein